MKKSIFLFLKGMAMGAADSVPGVSGGTIAFISGIYEELINSIRSVDFIALKLFVNEGPKAFWQHINGNFLFILLTGIVTSLLIFANLVLYLLDNYPLFLMSFFVGLILASCLFVAGQIQRWTITGSVLTFLGVLLTAGLSYLPQSQMEPGLVYIFFCAALAICAMILPGISGAFILLLLGIYEVILTAAKDLQWLILAVFISGCIVGLLSFSRLLAWLFKYHHDNIVCFLLGVLGGSLFVIWPWRVAVDNVKDASEYIVHYKNVSPFVYSDMTGDQSYVLFCLLLAIVGFVIVYGMEKITANAKNND